MNERETAREWQAIAYGDRPETWAALDYYRELGWPVDSNKFPERERVEGRIFAFMSGYRAGVKSAVADVCQWREIATAPKDGTPVLLYKRGHGAVQGWWSSGDAFLMPHWSTMSNLFDPTHWMPLPAPPVALVPAEGDR